MLTYADDSTPAEFDAGYANFIDAAVVERWEAHFRDASRDALLHPHVELAYGPHERNRIDLFPAPDAAPDAPVLVAIHGGLWFLFDKWMMHFLARAWTAAGIHVACPNYRLAPGASLDDIVADCRRAIGFLHRERSTLGIGSGPMFVTGHSAAGQLAAVMASTDWPEFDARLPACLLRGLVGVSGFYDIEPFHETGFQSQTRFTREAYRRWNPVNLVHPGLPPALLVTGARESGLLHAMMDGYAGLLRAAGVPVTAMDVPDEDHFSVLARLGDPSSEVFRRALAKVRTWAVT
jgi:arylformamidase